ncbi:MAG: hypothetical protein PUA71_08895 [Eubacteriales bacterium]|nr:hypothetical protein [Eubacteriales bacterium]
MAKKFGKALIFTAVASAIAAGGVALYNKYKASSDDFDDDSLDFDDEDEDFDDDTDDDDFDTDDDDVKSSDREYVSIPRDNSKEDDASDYKVNVDVTIDTTGFKADDDTDSEDDVEAGETVKDDEAKDSSVKAEAAAKADTEE